KTGVDLPEAKNYVGAYHHPAAVLADPDALDTLPAAELAAGWVEVLKTALIAGGTLWRRVAAGADRDPRTIVECARTKL
ncbi:3-dehydroquinate synthase, partial [Escherichia coli]